MTHGIPRSDLARGIVDVWCADLEDRSIGPDVIDEILSSEEQARAARFKFEPDAWRFKVGRAMLRVGLAIHLEKPPGTIQIRTAENGKPFLESGEIQFNVSHTGGTGLIAFSKIGALGVDIEAVDADVDASEIASAYFTQREAAVIADAPNEKARAECFIRFWTRKEAVLKATGSGIVDGLSSFDVSTGSVVKIRREDSQGIVEESLLLVKDLELSGNVMATIAGPNTRWSVRIWHVKPRLLLESVRSEFPSLLL